MSNQVRQGQINTKLLFNQGVSGWSHPYQQPVGCCLVHSAQPVVYSLNILYKSDADQPAGERREPKLPVYHGPNMAAAIGGVVMLNGNLWRPTLPWMKTDSAIMRS